MGGDVTKGDNLPYIPRHQLTVNAGIAFEAVRLSTSVNVVSKARASAGHRGIGRDDRIDGRALVDVVAEWNIIGLLSVFASATNVLNKVYNVSFEPAGARPGTPRTILAGVKAQF